MGIPPLGAAGLTLPPLDTSLGIRRSVRIRTSASAFASAFSGGAVASDALAELERVLGDAAGLLPEPFDPRQDEHLDLAAGLLLQRFRAEDDVDAYVLIVELSQLRLRQLAESISRRLAVMIDPD